METARSTVVVGFGGIGPVAGAVAVSAGPELTDALDGLVDAAAAGGGEAELRALRERHRSLASALGVVSDPTGFAAIERWIAGLALLGEAPHAARARIVETGERLWVDAAVAALRARGVDAVAAADLQPDAWWQGRREELLAVAAQGTPVYVVDGATVRRRAAEVRGLPGVARVLYALKANPDAAILRLLAREGLGFDAVSPGEIARVRAACGPDPFVLFTSSFASRAELAHALASGVRVTLDGLSPLERWPELFRGADLFLRLDPGKGRGHHDHVRTAGEGAKFGLAAGQLDRAAELARLGGARVVGLHAHVGSGILLPGAWEDVATFLGAAARRFPDARVLDLGGGLGVPDRPGRAPLDLAALGDVLARVALAHPAHELWLEPGRYLVAEAGVLLATVTRIEQKGPVRLVGVDAGMHTLLRPALYGAWHPVASLTRAGEPATTTVTVVGPICESADVLARDRRLPEPREGDVLLIGTAGAYGASMASDYNSRGLPRQVVLDAEPAA